MMMVSRGTAWLGNWLANMDGSYSSRPGGLALKMLPSEYVKRQVWCTFDRPLGLAQEYVELLEDRLMFASDYPHIESSTHHANHCHEKEANVVDDLQAGARPRQ